MDPLLNDTSGIIVERPRTFWEALLQQEMMNFTMDADKM